MLEEALQHFDGSVVVISHDRYFISKVATTIVAIEDKKLVKYGGDYKFYMGKVGRLTGLVEAFPRCRGQLKGKKVFLLPTPCEAFGTGREAKLVGCSGSWRRFHGAEGN